jgi:Xaa-Pro aminopeptidase
MKARSAFSAKRVSNRGDGRQPDRRLLDRSAGTGVAPALLLAEDFTGESSMGKRTRIGAELVQRKAEAALIFAPDSVSWLLNVRGRDVPRLPVLLSFAMLEADGSLHLVTDPAESRTGSRSTSARG